MNTIVNPALLDAVAEANAWLTDLMGSTRSTDALEAYSVLRATLQALRNRLPPEAAASLAGTLPLILKGVFYEGWSGKNAPRSDDHLEVFIAEIGKEAGSEVERTRDQAKKTCDFLVGFLTAGEIGTIMHGLPHPLRQFCFVPASVPSTTPAEIQL